MSSHLMSLSLLAIVSPDATREALEGKSEFWFICLLISSAGVAIGCLLEIGETWSDFKKWLSARKDPESSEEDRSWHKPLAAIGLLLVILGVVGEGVAEGFASIAETALRAHDEQVLGETIKEAGTAKDSADVAAKAAAQAKGTSDGAVAEATTAMISANTALATSRNARKGAESAERELDALTLRMNELNRVVDAESPRRLLLEKAAPDFVKKSLPFAGQRFTVRVCGTSAIRQGDEQTDTWATISHFLGDFAKWKDEFTGISDELCGRTTGIYVYVSSAALPNTVAAARNISDEFARILPPQSHPVLLLMPEQHLPGLEHSSLGLAINDPGLIVVEIGEQPTPVSKATADHRNEVQVLPIN